MADEEEAPPPPPPAQAASTPSPEGAEPGGAPADSTPYQRGTDPLNTEFLYYSSVLKLLGPSLTHESDRRVVIPWVRKLFRPEYQSSKLREKRNRYLAYLCNSLLLDEAIAIFRQMPPDGALACLTLLPVEDVPAATWEVDNTWQESLQNLPNNFELLECCIHVDENECKSDHLLDKILDQEFQLFLYIAKPYASLISDGPARTRAAAWLQILCSIHGNVFCSKMKAIRNDYMMALLGYLQDLRVVGPFAEYPAANTLKPLAEAAKLALENNPITDPSGMYADEFLADQPMPDDGAFCYIALSGELVSSNLAQD